MTATTVREPGRDLLVRGEYDVIVAGAGLGGIAAALASGRTGARTLLVERNSFAGGVATAGMCCSIFNCYYSSQGELCTTGIPVEIADRLAEATGFGKKWHKHKGHIIYDIERAKRLFDEMLADAGVELLYSTLATSAVTEGDRVRGVIVEDKLGREAILAKVVVDATADGDILAAAGAPHKVRERALNTLCFRMGNVDVDAFVDYFRKHPEQYPPYQDVEWSVDECLAQYDDCGTFLFPHGATEQVGVFQKAIQAGVIPEKIGITDCIQTHRQMHALRDTGIVHVIAGFTHFNGLDPKKITQSITDGREMVSILVDVYRKYVPGFENAFVAGTAANLGVRASRTMQGDFLFTREMMAAGTRQPDAIARCVGWGSSSKGKECQALFTDSCDVPYRCLLPGKVEGIIPGTGRGVSTTSSDLLRVMVHTMAVGQASGTTAALSANADVLPRDLDVPLLQRELTNQGVDLG